MSSDVGQWIEAMLLVIVMVQIARLLWALATPVGLFGEWRAPAPVVVGADARSALFAGFDPFFRTGTTVGPNQAPVQQVTSLPLKLYGIRVNEASGLGAAIIANEGGVQTSYKVGAEISPGVRLKSVAFDHVVIERGGASEQLFIDQSGSAPTAPAGAPTGPVPPGVPGSAMPASLGAAPGMVAGPNPSAGPPLSAERLSAAVGLAPRTEGGRITGLVVSQRDDGAVFAQAGFRPGDIIVQVDGRPIGSAADIQGLQSSLRPGARLSLMVERGSATVPIALILPDNK